MKITRRRFLLHTGAAAFTATVVFPGKNIFSQTRERGEMIPPASTNDPLSFLMREHFEPFVNSNFEFQAEDGRKFNLKLALVEDLSLTQNQKLGLNGQSYSLVFENLRKSSFAQGTYQISHESLGSFALLIVPIGVLGKRYEAVINRINT